MRALLDTHCWLWLQTDPGRLGEVLLADLGDPSSERYLSSASAWEIAIKYALGKLPLPEDPTTYVPDRMRISRFRELPITHADALAVTSLPPHHRDPFDRLLVAQARDHGLTLVTADAVIESYDVSMLRVGGPP